MRYDANKQRVIYEPVTIEERINIPRVIKDDNRYAERLATKQGSQGDNA